jgi:uncharacterized protein (TIGR02145 family)
MRKVKIIGNQIWEIENLDVSFFRNGDAIPEAKTDVEWEKAGDSGKPVWCYYDNSEANGQKYGKLYNGHAIIDPRGLAPEGSKVPSDEDWGILIEYLGGELAGKKMKSTSGWNENGNGSNESGFDGLPGGYRYFDGAFYCAGKYGYWWSSRWINTNYAPRYDLNYDNGFVAKDYSKKQYGYSVRCIRV